MKCNYKKTNFVAPKSIAVMLDLDGTTDFIDKGKAQIFINQLKVLQKKFNADYGTISISTHHRDADEMMDILHLLAKQLPKTLKIGDNFYYGGIYDYNQRLDICKEYKFNANKVDTFDKHYVSNPSTNNQWFAIIDDNVGENTYMKYQNTHPMLVCRPSQQYYNPKKDCLMNLATSTKGFDGVLELLDRYINLIKDLSPIQILEAQKNMIMHLSSWDLSNKIMDRDYSFIYKYFSEGYADRLDYGDALTMLIFDNKNKTITKDEYFALKNILQLFEQNFITNNDSDNMQKVKEFRENYNIC